MTAAAVALHVLDTPFRLVSDDERMLGFVRELWAPFEVDRPGPESLQVSIEASRDGWKLSLDGEPRGAAQDPWVFAAVLRNSISAHAIAGAASVVPLHGAAAEREGVYVLLSAPPEAGKTTLLLALLERGWRLVTDDLIPLNPERLTASPFLKPISVREPERWRRHAAGWSVPEWLPPPRVVGLLPATVFQVTEQPQYRAALVVFPSFEPDSAPMHEELTTAQTVAATAANLHLAGRATPAQLAAVARWAGATPGHTIRYGGSEDAVNLLETCLAGLERTRG